MKRESELRKMLEAAMNTMTIIGDASSRKDGECATQKLAPPPSPTNDGSDMTEGSASKSASAVTHTLNRCSKCEDEGYYGVEHFTPAQKKAYEVGYLHGSGDANQKSDSGEITDKKYTYEATDGSTPGWFILEDGLKVAQVFPAYEHDREENLRIVLGALNKAPKREYSEEVSLKESVAEQLHEKDGYWHTCSGCYEGGEYGGNSHNYPFSDIFQCQQGSGCHECGGLGVRWDNTSYEEALKSTQIEDREAK